MSKVLWEDDGTIIKVSDPDYPGEYDREFKEKQEALDYFLNMIED